ncbi:MAG: FG-GAP-like repeat-containing protein [Edaphobacter sp.]
MMSLALALGGGWVQAWATVPATMTTLAASSGGSPSVTVTQGASITLTATVAAGTSAVSPGQVRFCDEITGSCEGFHLLGMSQLMKNGTASISFTPPSGQHIYQAFFVGNKSAAASSSNFVSFFVIATALPTLSSIASTGSAGDYTLTTTLTGLGSKTLAPTGTVSFMDELTAGNTTIGTAVLGSATSGLTFQFPPNPVNPVAQGTFSTFIQGDFNNDGKLDIAVAEVENYVVVLLGHGDGTFTSGARSPTGSSPQGLATGDFNGDGKLDIAVPNPGGNTVSVLLGNGDGTFQAPNVLQTTSYVTTGMNNGPLTIVSGDFNNDGNEDIAVGNGLNYNGSYQSLSVFLGDGNGNFTTQGGLIVPSLPPGSLANSPTYNTLSTADVNGDGVLDLVASGTYLNPGFNPANAISVLLGNGDGTFTQQWVWVTPQAQDGPLQNVASLVITDFNGDGKLDLAFGVNSAPGGYNVTTIDVLLGNGDGTFTLSTPPPISGVNSFLAVGDFNGDGVPDLMINDPNPLYLGNGDGTFANSPSTWQCSYVIFGEPCAPLSGVIGDFNGDGNSDIVIPSFGGADTGLSFLTETATAIASGVTPVGSGTHQVFASYPGDSNYMSSVSDAIGLAAAPVPTTLLLTANTTSAASGSPVTLTATLTPYSAAPNFLTDGELINFYDGANPIGVGSLSSGIAVLNLNTLPPGTNLITAQYQYPLNNPNSYFASSSSNVVSIQVTQATASTIAWPAPASISYGTPLTMNQLDATSSVAGTFVYMPPLGTVLAAGQQTLNVTFTPTDTMNYAMATGRTTLAVQQAALTVTAASATRKYGAANPTLTAAVTGAINGDMLTTSASTVATITSAVGTYSIVPTVGGGAARNYAVTPVNGTLTVTQAGSATALTASASAAGTGSSLTFTATATSATSGTPTGTVQFLNGSSVLGMGTLTAGVATFTTSSLAAGSYNVIAVYGGDTNFTPSTSSSASVVVATPDYSITSNPTSLTIQQGQSGTATFTMTPTGGFNQTITFACAGLPSEATCSFSPASVTPNGAPVTSQLTITTVAPVNALLHGSDPLQKRGTGGAGSWSQGIWCQGSVALALFAGIFAGTRRRKIPNILRVVIFLAAICLIPLAGCGGGTSPNSQGSTTPPNPGTPAGTSQVAVTASAGGSGGVQHTASLTVIITN